MPYLHLDSPGTYSVAVKREFQTALTWPQQRIQALLERGLQREGDFENRWPALLGTLLET